MANKLDLVFKKVVNRQYTTANKEWYEENPGVPFKLKGSDVWVDNIPEVPPVADTSVIKGYRSENKLQLSEDTSVNSKRCWYADDGGRIDGFVTPRYGQGYTARLFIKDGAEVPTTHSCGWFFDFESGNLTFDSNPSSLGSDFEIIVYKYIGSTADDLAKSISGTAWQDPVLDIVNEPVGTEVGEERYLIGGTPTGVFAGHAGEIVKFDGVNWKFETPTKIGDITYVIGLDRLYVYDDNGGWAWSGIDAADLDYNNADSDLNSLSVKDALDELDALLKSPSTIIHVDSNRTDNYISTGTIIKPFKTLSSAIGFTSPGDSLHMVPGTYDGDGLNTADNISIIGDSVDNTFIQNDITIGLDTTSSLTVENIYFNNSNTVVLNNASNLRNVKANGRLTINGDCIGHNIDIKSASPGAALTINGESVSMSILTVSHSGDQYSLLHNSGTLSLLASKISGTRASDPVAISENGTIETNFTSIDNAGGGKALVINNSAPIATPNKFYDTIHSGGIDCNDSITIVEGVQGGNPTSTIQDDINLIYRSGTQLKNDSTIIKDESGGILIGKTLNDSIDRVAQVSQYDPDHGFMIVEPCIDDV